MTTANDPLKSIQSRIDELEETISDRGEQIRARANQLKEELQEELSPMELIRKHPVESAGISFATGIVAGRIIRSVISPKSRKMAVPAAPQPPAAQPGRAEKPQPAPAERQAAKPSVMEAALDRSSSSGMAIGAIGVELIHALRDMAVTWIKSRGEAKKDSAC
ncbi:MAG: hypothetical protein JW764_09580 [Chlorobiaceae bacterium]|nr:hypothetical protein [Chlorobiaceae bacterium]